MAKRKIIPDFDLTDYLSIGAGDKRFGKIYEGMLKSPKWQGLKPMAKVLYQVIIVHYATTDNYKQLFAYCQSQNIPGKYKGNGYFMLSRAKLQSYGLDATHCYRYFRELIENGFIDLIESNQHRQIANVYRLSKRWKDNS